MRLVVIISILSMSLLSCQQAIFRDARKVDAELDSYRLRDAGQSVTSVEACWKKDSLLVQLIDSVLVRSNDIKIGFLNLAMSRAQYTFDRGAMKPTVAGVVQPSLRRFSKYSMDGVGNFDTQFSPNISKDQIIPEHLPDYMIGLQSSWEVDLWGKLSKRKRASALRYLATEAGQQWYITSLVSEVAGMYGQLVALDQELDILKTNIAIQNSALSLVKIQKEAGVVNESAVQQLEAQWLNSRAQEGLVLQQITELENQLRYWLNSPNKKIVRSQYPFNCSLDSTMYAQIQIDQLERRPDIRQAKLELEAQLLNKESAELALKPSLVLSGMLGVQGFRPEYLFQLPSTMAYQLIGGLTTPWLNRSALYSNINRENARWKSLDLAYQNALLKGFLEWDTQVKSLAYLQRMDQLKEREVMLTKGAIATVGTLFTTAKANYLEVLTAQQNALRSELELLEISRKRWIHAIQLYRVLGGGW
ncbi:TolC family protein [Aquirufa rosea]|uniref:TolC family protein n=1 Tax=Aquirufa rosea TaxID=2509241 RepID=A0A4Q1C182_9BACT|nr:TolC family protein [Aquirufa rosea]RXK50909.1 TolC family protein [Aquirufa rosea]